MSLHHQTEELVQDGGPELSLLPAASRGHTQPQAGRSNRTFPSLRVNLCAPSLGNLFPLLFFWEKIEIKFQDAWWPGLE